MKYPCLIVDHDDTVVNSTATVHFPCFVEYLAQYRPEYHCTLEHYFLRNFDRIGESLSSPSCPSSSIFLSWLWMS